MQRRFQLIATILLLAPLSSLAKRDKSNDYQVGTYVSVGSVGDGTITSTLRGDGTTVAGDVYANRVRVYRVKVADGTWYLETMAQASDSGMRSLGMTPPAHLRSEKANPLDLLKSGDKVMFRLEKHKKIGGTETDVFIPFADNPNKEAKFVASFAPDLIPDQPAARPTDNVKAMCDSGRLSPELRKQYCESAPK